MHCKSFLVLVLSFIKINSHTIKCPNLKYKAKWILTYLDNFFSLQIGWDTISYPPYFKEFNWDPLFEIWSSNKNTLKLHAYQIWGFDKVPLCHKMSCLIFAKMLWCMYYYKYLHFIDKEWVLGGVRYLPKIIPLSCKPRLTFPLKITSIADDWVAVWM